MLTELRRDFINSQLLRAELIVEDFANVYPKPFLEMMRYVIRSEGGLAPGNHTLYGLDENAHPDLKHKIRSGTLTIDETLARYHRDYYSKLPGLGDVPKGLRYFIFDSKIQGCTYCVGEFLLPLVGLVGHKSFSSKTFALLSLLPSRIVKTALHALHKNPHPMAKKLFDNVNANARRDGRTKVSYESMLKRVNDRITHSIKFMEGQHV